ncbi:DoxX family protein [Roseixanthobacter pseudopolyaromaticivorans]|uniref:DoxX family protein n=1 Tax=Xanthobacteraceae TaxID=335928 RepID=UPI00372A4971
MATSILGGVQACADAILRSPAMALLARIAVAAPFLFSGFAKLADFNGAIGEVRGLTGLEPAALFAALVIATQLGGSALLIAGARLTWIGAALLAAFTAVATLSAHAFWLKPVAEQVLNRNIFIEHISIIGGLAAVAILAARPPADGREAGGR